MSEQWSADWSNAVFSLEERDRRWARVRSLMARDGIDVIVCPACTNSHDRGQQDVRYLTQLGENSDETTVVFPLEGEVAAWHSRGGVWPSCNWLTTVRAARRGTSGRTAAAWLRETGFRKGTIGVAGLTSTLLAHVRAIEGEANWGSVEALREAFPEARIVSATGVLGEARYQKSEEEIDFLRRATQVAEATLRAAAAVARAGVPERAVFGEMMKANALAGGSFTPMFGWISGPLGATYHRLEQPTFRSLRSGDVLGMEVEGRWGGYIAQIDDQLSIGPAPADLREGTKLSWESFDRALAALRPGVTVGELVAAAEVRGLDGRGVAHLILHGRGTGDDGPLATGDRSPDMLATPLLENCCFILKPSTSVDGRPDFGRWGETVVVRAGGAERLGTRPQQLFECV